MLEIKGIEFEVEINRKKIKNMYLRLDGNKVIVSAPFRVPEYEIYKFINSRRDWIYKTYDYNVYKNRVSRLYSGGDIFYIYSVPYRIHFYEGKNNVLIRDNTIFLTYKNDDRDSAIRYLYKYLDKYLLNKAEEIMNKRISFLMDYGYNQIPVLKCKIMKSRWGVCYTRKNEIHISSYLIHYPLQCLEYIMIHEMTHFIVPNHSKRFYEIVEYNMPDYKSANEMLKM